MRAMTAPRPEYRRNLIRHLEYAIIRDLVIGSLMIATLVAIIATAPHITILFGN